MTLVPVPSTASLARIFRKAGVARREPRKKSRSVWRRFVSPAPDACWQLDATGYVLAGVVPVDKMFYKVDVTHAFDQVLVVSDGAQPGDKVIVTDLEGEILAERTRPAPGISYVGNGRHHGRCPNNPGTSPKS